MNNKFVLFKFDGEEILVSYICKKEYVSQNEIEDAIQSYIESHEEDLEYINIVDDVMSSFEDKGLEFHFEDFSTIVVE